MFRKRRHLRIKVTAGADEARIEVEGTDPLVVMEQFDALFSQLVIKYHDAVAPPPDDPNVR